MEESSIWVDLLKSSGISGLPMVLEIIMMFGVLSASAIFLLRESPEEKESKYKHLALPAFVMTPYQKSQLKQLFLPVEAIIQNKNVPEISNSPTATKIFEKFKSPKAKPKRKSVRINLSPDNYRFFSSRTPVCVFVNRKSGGQQGELMLFQLRSILPKYQVYDLIKDGGPRKGLKFFQDVPFFNVLVCGGDGTISWVLNTIDDMQFQAKPRVGVLPLGTGNDMAQVLGWGTGAQSVPILEHLLCLTRAKPVVLDRWRVRIRDAKSKSRKESEGEEKIDESNEDLAKKDGKSSSSQENVMNNYIGIGVDAQIALNFHLNRENQPHLFTNRFLNKLWYTGSGAKEILMQRFLDFSSKITLFCDGVPVKIPMGIEGIIILNIRSYGGGVDLWGDAEQVDATKGRKSRGKGMETSKSFFNLNGSSSSSDRRRRKSFTDADFQNLRSKMSRSGELNGHSVENESKINNLNQIGLDKAGIMGYNASAEIPRTFMESQFNDGMVEVVGVQSSFELGAAQVGLTRPTKLCQGSHIVVHLSGMGSCPVQIDGEPFTLKDSELDFKEKLSNLSRSSKRELDKVIEVGYLNNTVMLSLLKRFKDEADDEVEHEDHHELYMKDTFCQVLSWGMEKGLIDDEQKHALELKMNTMVNARFMQRRLRVRTSSRNSHESE